MSAGFSTGDEAWLPLVIAELGSAQPERAAEICPWSTVADAVGAQLLTSLKLCGPNRCVQPVASYRGTAGWRVPFCRAFSGHFRSRVQ